MSPVDSKQDFVQRFLKNEFGNRGPTWDTYDEFRQSGYRGLIHIRNREAGAKTWYNVPAADVFYEMRQIIAHGEAIEEDLYFAAMAPTEKTLIQGEVMLDVGGLYLFYSTIAKPMRDALKERAESEWGISAILRLRHYLDPSSYDDMMELLGTYPDHVVEFSTYSCDWGTCPNRNTIFWEVRMY